MALPPGPETDARHAREAADPENYRERDVDRDGYGPKYVYDPGHRNRPAPEPRPFPGGLKPSPIGRGNSGNKIDKSNRNGKMSEIRLPREDDGDRGGWNRGAAWNRKPARRDMDIVDKELNRYQPAFDKVQRYPEGYGGQPVRDRDYGGGGGRRRGGGGMDDNKFDRFISAIEGISGGGNITNTFNPTFNPTNVNAGRDIRDTSIIGGGPNTAGRDITGAGGDVETGDNGGGNTVTGPGGNTQQPVDPNPGDPNPGDPNPGDPNPGNKYDAFIHSTYNDLLGRDAGQEGLDYWSKDLEGGQTEQQVIDNIKLSPEYLNRETAKGLASSMEGKTYERDTPTSLGNINESTLDGWIGPGGHLTQSSDPTGKAYFEGVGDKSSAAEYLYNRPVGDGEAGITGFPSNLSERDEKIYDLYTNVFGRNPDKEGFDYWTSAESDKMSLADVEASFKGSAEAKLRDNVGGTSNYQSIDDYVAGKQNPAATDGVPMGSNNASTGQSAPGASDGLTGQVDNYLNLLGAKDQLLADKDTLLGDKDALLGDKDNLIASLQEVTPGTGEVTPLPRVVDGPPGAEIPGLETDPIGTLYGDLLGRSPDKEGYDYWTNQLKSGNQSYDQIADNIMRSEEYQQKRGTRGRSPKPIVGPLPQPPAPPKPLPTPMPIAPVRGVPGGTINPTDWLQQAYTEAGLGKVDPGGRDYWMGDLGKGQSKADVIANIMRHKK